MKQKIALWIINKLLKWVPNAHLHQNPKKRKEVKK